MRNLVINCCDSAVYKTHISLSDWFLGLKLYYFTVKSVWVVLLLGENGGWFWFDNDQTENVASAWMNLGYKNELLHMQHGNSQYRCFKKAGF